jgi:hypothetical protein
MHCANFLCYNCFIFKLHVMVDPLTEAIILKPAKFTIHNHRFILLKNQYYEPIYEGKATILKAHQCVLRLNHNL